MGFRRFHAPKLSPVPISELAILSEIRFVAVPSEVIIMTSNRLPDRPTPLSFHESD